MMRRFNSYDQAIEFLYGRVNYERAHDRAYTADDFKLDRMRRLLELLGNPQERIPAVHVAGTKGKGSTAVMIAGMLTAAGYRTGLFTSPHISAFEERMTVDGVRPEPEQLVALVNRAMEAIETLDAAPGQMSPTYFEIATAIGWLDFVERGAEIVVLEVGMGGRLDATNICRPEVCVITSISRDHTAFLGNTLAAIAGEKAGIIKPGVPVVSGVLNDEPRTKIREVAATVGAPLLELGQDFQFEIVSGESNGNGSSRLSPFAPRSARIETFRRGPLVVRLPLAGEHQGANAAVAISVIDILCEKGWRISDASIHDGLARVHWPARIELVSVDPAVVIDAAHNVASVQALVKTLNAEKRGGGRRVLIFAGTKDKDVPDLLRELLPEFDEVVLTKYNSNPRAVPIEELEEMVATIGHRRVHSAADPLSAWQLARTLVGPDDLVCVTGSFFIAAEIRELVLAQQKRLPEQFSPADAVCER